MNDSANELGDEQAANAIIDAFDAAWSAGQKPSLTGFADQLNQCSNAAETLRELVMIDLEYRWKNNINDDAPAIRDYINRFPEIVSDCLSAIALLAEEYRARTIWGDRPTHDNFITDYPEYVSELIREMKAVDEQLLAEEQRQPRDSARPIVADDPRAPLPFHDYLLQKHLGTGGMGRVYIAWQKSLNRRVAVKALRKSRQRNASAVDAFVREAVIAGGLRHPNIVGIHGLGRFPSGGYFLVMDYIRGADLAQLCATRTFQPGEAAEIARQIAIAVAYAHRQGVVHCDLKPSNALIDEQNHVYIVDFGLARLTANSMELADVQGGTWAYLAPEQLTVETHSIDPRVDVFGIGGILYTLLIGRPPRDAARGKEGLSTIQSPKSINARLSDELNAICMRCLADRPEDRFETVEELADVLQVTREDA